MFKLERPELVCWDLAQYKRILEAGPWAPYAQGQQVVHSVNSAGKAAVEGGIGVLEGVCGLAKGVSKTAQRFSGDPVTAYEDQLQLKENIRREGFWGGIYTSANEQLNPAYGALVGGYETKQARERGDPRGVTPNL
jgi:hypothetical protein